MVACQRGLHVSAGAIPAPGPSTRGPLMLTAAGPARSKTAKDTPRARLLLPVAGGPLGPQRYGGRGACLSTPRPTRGTTLGTRSGAQAPRPRARDERPHGG